ncbi:MAG: PilZ domain-containing protein, partial [Proteobacteria bacterium]
RVAYMTGVQVLSRHGALTGTCINISAGGILVEMSKAELVLGDIIEVKILPGLINRSIACKAQVIGKIPKIPPGFALKFEDLKNEDKEAIEFFVQEMLKREL